MRHQLSIAKIIVLSRAGDHRSPLHIEKSRYKISIHGNLYNVK
ncbi:MAG: hypothetical protein R3Y53_10345 [Bacillota bacterium]